MRVNVTNLACAIALSVSLPAIAAAAAKEDEVKFLDQGWSRADREWMYSFPQGSRIVEYKWWRALEIDNGTAPFAADGLARFNYLPRAATPDLPIGFTVERDKEGVEWLGMNCSACHTGRVQIGATTLQIDGAPTMADFGAFIAALGTALQSTAEDDAKFARFSQKVSGAYDPALRESLSGFALDFAKFVKDSTPPHPWGPARLDALGMTYNRIAVIDLGIDANHAVTNAPASYPFLWTTPRQREGTQWVGFVPNHDEEKRLMRNIGQILGVFGVIPGLKSQEAFEQFKYSNSIRIDDLKKAEMTIEALKAPSWPAKLAPIDKVAVAKGKKIYETQCRGCHLVDPGHGDVGTRIVWVGTDKNTWSTIKRFAYPGVLREDLDKMQGCSTGGQPKVPLGLMVLCLEKLIIEHSDNDAARAFSAMSTDFSRWRFSVATPSTLRPRSYGLGKQGTRPRRVATPSAAAPKSYDPNRIEDSYKAGPLSGIWATGPFLHNGSVPTIYDLLLPPERRPKKFWVGGIKLDTDHLGFFSGPADGGTFELDTSLDGNSNAGHNIGTELEADAKRNLLEYLKTL